VRVCHLGDLGQSSLREEQVEAIGDVDLLFVPVGGGPTMGAEQAAEVVGRLAPRWAVPMHYRSERIGFLEPADAFLEIFGEDVRRLEASWFQTEDHPAQGAPLILVPAAP
jgi:L-ascorbate metabolism protein UlaG (beta-lactamase superfamily)